MPSPVDCAPLRWPSGPAAIAATRNATKDDIDALVAGKTVAMKINLTGSPKMRPGHKPAELAQYTHPAVIGTTIHLMHKAGARLVRLLESPWSTTDPLEEYMMDANWDPSLLLKAGGIVEMENTNYLGAGKQYHKFVVPNGGHTFKERPPSKSVAAENDPSSPRDDKYRIPRIVADIVGAAPVHLAIIDGIESMARGEGPWRPGTFHVSPGLLVVGKNIVTTDAVGSALMGFDPMADRGTPPYERRDSTLKLAEMHGGGTRDLRRIEVIGGRINDMRFDFRAARRS